MKYYRFAVLASVAVFVLIGIVSGPAALITLAILAVLEISFSFDNAVVNAQVLQRLSPKWQTVFITIGVLIAVGGMRFVFPILVVSLTAHLGFGQVVQLAVHNPHVYATKLASAHDQIAVFGGTFLLMIFLDFVFEDRDVKWLGPLERPLAKAGKLDSLSVIIALAVILSIAMSVSSKQLSIALAGGFSLLTYKVVNALANVFEDEDEEESENSTPKANLGRVGWGAFVLFIYLEIQDAMFSFDGVSGAFAVTDKVILIAAGLGIGAVFVRSMTLQLMKSGKLAELVYLDHGAHWAIGSLAICLFLTIGVSISDYVIGLIGVTFIGAAVIHSYLHKPDSSEPIPVEQPVPATISS